MVLRLGVPLTHSLRARNWNFAACGASFTALSVAADTGDGELATLVHAAEAHMAAT